MNQLTLKYSKIYLVGINEERTSSHRVVDREGKQRPENISFSGRFPLENGEDTYGTLVLDEEMWKRFEGKELMAGMGTAEEAAETLVGNFTNIFYGCPLCSYRTKNRGEDEEHISAHLARFVSQFQVVEEGVVGEPTLPKRRTRRLNHQAQELTPELLQEVT